MKPLMQSAPLYKQVYEEIKTSILRGDFKQGDKISVNKLAEEFEISRTPLRESLRQLQKEGLLEQDQSGTKIAQITETDFNELCTCRLILERELIKEVTLIIEEEQINEAEKMIELAKNSLNKDLQMEILEYNSKFHKILINACNNNRLKDLLDQVRAKLLLYRANVVYKLEQTAEILEEHSTILKAIKERNVEKAVIAVDTHLSNDQVRGQKVFGHD
ncbi:GntR family transcriptional regulator [Salibacterium salarium]|uniref:GntR family transcriptional regulator n=1 Tax=Salibacterium salarium TaxID=284579 RepID=A0A428N6X0_9BACI|nr:GntR family transcriptional regulator [Salibacterium salarium]RSL34037.1 GntR family transcriptional regulator [Salibacterium salarium]